MPLNTKTLVVLVGPTAVGKTALAVELAQIFNTEIISADSRQCYKELSIGTAKPTQEEQGGIAHHFIDSHSIVDPVNVSDYEKLVLATIEKLFKKKDLILLSGGTGLYVNAVCNGLDPLPPANEDIREQLNELLSAEGIEGLQKKLKEVDPEYYNSTDLNNPQRLIRAIEVSLVSGELYSKLRSGVKKEREFKILKIGVDRPREELYDRINKRVDEMIKGGLLEEVKNLEEYKSFNALNTVGYKEMFAFLEGRMSWEETIGLIKQNTRRYAKRQLTWFRNDENIHWFHPDNKEEIISYIKEHVQIPQGL